MSLIKTIDELRKHLPVSVSLSLENLAPYIRDAEQAAVMAFVSEELYNRILGQLMADTPEMAPKEVELLEKMQLVAVRFALSEYIPAGEVIIGDDGITTVGKGTSRTAAYDRQIVRLLESTIRQAWNALDRLLAWLEKNAGEFPEYTGSEQYTRFRRGLVRDTTTFNDIYYIASSRLTFQAVHPELLNVEEDRLIPLITREHYDIIHSGVGLSELYTRLLSVSRKAVIFQAVANVIQLQQNVSLDAGTLRVYGTTNSAGDNVQYYQKPTTADRKDAGAKAQARADMYFDSLAEILDLIQGNDQEGFEAGIMGDEIVML